MYNNTIEFKNNFIPNNKNGITISKLCGALAADGTIYKQNKIWNGYPASSYYFEIADGWKENIFLASEWIKSIIKKKGSIESHRKWHRYRIGNKILVQYFHSLEFPYGKKSTTVSVPSQILNNTREHKLAFISGLLIFDGTVKIDGTIEFSTKSRKLYDQIISILKKEEIHIRKFRYQITKWSTGWKYGFSSRSADFFMNILDGPKKRKLKVIKKGEKLDIDRLMKLFPEQTHSKLPFLKEIYNQLRNSYPDKINFKSIKDNIEQKYQIVFHRNTLLGYLNLFVKSKIAKRIKVGWYKFDIR